MKILFTKKYKISSEVPVDFDTQNKKNLGFKPSTPNFVAEHRMGQITGASSIENQREIEKRLGKPNPTQRDIENYTKLYEISDNVDVNRSRNLLIARLELNVCDLEISKIIGERERKKRAKKFPFISINEADRLIELESQKAKYQNQITHIERIINKLNINQIETSAEKVPILDSLETWKNRLAFCESGIEQSRISGDTAKELALYRSRSTLMQKILTLEPTFNPNPVVSSESFPIPVVPSSPEQKENIKVAKVYEFWTGIEMDKVGEDFVSKRFTGQYMMNSFSKNIGKEGIPDIISTSIYNDYFKISQGSSKEGQTYISRVVKGDNGETWSILSVVNTFQEIHNNQIRSCTGYRYFATEGENLGVLISNIKSKELSGEKTNFDIKFANQNKGKISEPNSKEYEIKPTILNPELNLILNKALLNKTIPLLLPYGINCSFEQAIYIAEKLTKNQSNSTAYKVEAIVKPESFAVVIPASKNAEQILKMQIENIKKLDVEQNSIDSQLIKSAFKGLMNGKIDIRYLQTLQDTFDKISNPKEIRREEYDLAINKSVLSQGLENAILQNINTPQVYRLQALAHLFGADIGKTKLPIERMILTTKRVLRSPKQEINPDVKVLLDNLESQTTGIFQQRVKAFKSELQSKL
jgi:hypothetical protein